MDTYENSYGNSEEYTSFFLKQKWTDDEIE